MQSLLYDGPLILASRSPRRQELLRRLGVEFEVQPADVPEDAIPGLGAAETAVELARRKAAAVAATRHRGLILGADTIVVRDREILGKPLDGDDACRMFASLCGRPHEVITGLVLLDAGSGRCLSDYEETRVFLRAASVAEVRRYVDTGEPMDKAGGYGAQGIGAAFIERVEGCFYNVVGLPLVRLHALLEAYRKGVRDGDGVPADARGEGGA